MSNVEVFREGSLIRAVYRGVMTLETVREGEALIEKLLKSTPDPVILYDTLQMAPPTIDLAVEMKNFDGRIRDRVRRSATVVPGAMTAFMAKVAFAFSREHKVFYNDRDAALEWLTGSVSAAERPEAAR